METRALSPGSVVRAALLGLIRLYQLTLSPWLGNPCRYEPTCSRYAAEAIERHGAVRGVWLAAKRLGISRTTLRTKLAALGVSVERRADVGDR